MCNKRDWLRLLTIAFCDSVFMPAACFPVPAHILESGPELIFPVMSMQIIIMCPALVAWECGVFQNTLEIWQCCDDELGLSLEKIMAHQSRSRHSFCTTEKAFQEYKQAKVVHRLTTEQKEVLLLDHSGNVGLLAAMACSIVIAGCSL